MNPTAIDGIGEINPSPDIHKENEMQRIPIYEKYIAWVERFSPGRRWLDIGCGCGTFMEVLHRAGYEVEGIETDEQRLFHCRSRGLRVHTQSIESDFLPPKSFDAISMINVFSHLRDPIIVFNVIKRVLRPDGIIFLTTSQCGKKAYQRGRA
jgi:2-polyprenyl-3-methyl-5-hydroxy-6-metoxy-1,4-benzoquinol methylase